MAEIAFHEGPLPITDPERYEYEKDVELANKFLDVADLDIPRQTEVTLVDGKKALHTLSVAERVQKLVNSYNALKENSRS